MDEEIEKKSQEKKFPRIEKRRQVEEEKWNGEGSEEQWIRRNETELMSRRH